MLVEIIINRGVINFESLIKSGTTAELLAGEHKILFSDFNHEPFQDSDYDLIINVTDSDGIPSAYVEGLKEEDGFNISLPFDSIVKFQAVKS